jgi:hypothetical protein
MGATAYGNAAAASPFFSFFPSPPLRLLGAAAAIHGSLAAEAIRAWLSHGRHRVRQHSSYVDVLFILAAASLYRVRHRSSHIAVASLLLLGAAEAVYLFAFRVCFVFSTLADR